MITDYNNTCSIHNRHYQRRIYTLSRAMRTASSVSGFRINLRFSRRGSWELQVNENCKSPL